MAEYTQPCINAGNTNSVKEVQNPIGFAAAAKHVKCRLTFMPKALPYCPKPLDTLVCGSMTGTNVGE